MGQGLDTLRKSQVRVVGKKSNPERLRVFLDTLADSGVINAAARRAGFSPTSAKYYIQKAADGDPAFVIRWRDVEGPFNELVQAAIADSLGRVEECAFRRATGYKEVQVHQGRVQYEIDYDAIALGAEPGSWESFLKDKNGKRVPVTVTKQSEDLQMFILKKRLPDIYGDKSQVEMLHRGGVMIVTAPVKTSKDLEEKARRMAEEPVEVEFIEVEDEPVPAAASDGAGDGGGDGGDDGGDGLS